MYYRKLAVLSLCLLAGSLSNSLWAQFTSAIDGTVTDPSGAVVANAIVIIKNTETGVEQKGATNATGYYRFPSLPPSVYSVTASAAGFKTTVQQNVRVQISEIRTVNIALEVGATATEVTVNAAPPPIETSEAKVSGLIDEKTLHDLPIGNRNFYSLVQLTPGVVGVGGAPDIYEYNAQVNMYSGGHRADANDFRIDSTSVSGTQYGGQVTVSPNIEAIQEVRVLVNSFSAEKGRNSAAEVNAVTKSGTNEWHGTATWYHTNNDLTARSFFQPKVPVSRKNEGTGSLGGPVIKDHTFIFGSVDILRGGIGTGAAVYLPTQQFRNFIQQARPNNVGSKVLNQFAPKGEPTANFVTAGKMLGQACGGDPNAPINSDIGPIPCNLPVIGQYNWADTNVREGTQWNLRADHVFGGSRDRLYGNVVRTKLVTAIPLPQPAFNVTDPFNTVYVSLNETHTFSPHILNEASASFVRTYADGMVTHGEVPFIYTADGLQCYGCLPGPIIGANNNYHFRDGVTVIKGSHNLKIGGNLSRDQANSDQVGISMRPGFIFINTIEVAADNPFTEVNIDIDPKTGARKGLIQKERTMNGGLYIQDDWKARRNLTLNLGLRFETFGNPADVAGRLTNMVYQGGDNYVSRIANAKSDYVTNLYQSSLNNWAPRFGFAWDPTSKGKVSIRGGFGLFYDRPSDYLFQNAGLNPPVMAQITATTQSGPTDPKPLFALGTLTEQPYNYPYPAGIKAGLNAKNGIPGLRVSLLASEPDFKTAYSENWFLGVQKAFGNDWIAEINYIGSAGHRLYVQPDVNRFDGDLIQNRGVLTRLNNAFDKIELGQSAMNSFYSGATAQLKKRFRSLNFDAAYTFGKAMDYLSAFHALGGALASVAESDNYSRQRGRADFDARQKLALTAVWNLPQPGGSALVRKAFGGWELAGIAVLQSGTPFSVICSAPFSPIKDAAGNVIGDRGCDYNADGVAYDFPMTPSWGNSLSGLSRSDYAKGIMKASDFKAPSLGQQGDLGRNTFQNPGYANTDLSLIKNTRIPWFWGQEGANTQLRAEAFNLFNRVNLGGVNGAINAATFGRSTSASGGRLLQLGLRVQF